MKKLSFIDIFGSQTQFRFQGQQTYKTHQGAFITIAIATIVFMRLLQIVYDVYNRKDPTVLFRERQVNSPAPFHMTNSTLQFAFGMQEPVNYQHYVNLTVYNITVKQTTKKLVFNQKTQKDEFIYVSTEVKVGPCTEDSFQNPKTRDYFLKQDYKNLMCIDPKQEMVIEGDYTAESHSYFTIKVIPCQKNCDPNIDKLLSKAFFAIYYSDILIDPQDKEKPFQYYTRDNYWTTSVDAPRDVNFQYRNTYVDSDFGWVFDDKISQSHAQFSTSDISYLPSTFKNYFFQLVVRMEKQKENLYQRKYKNIFNIVSEIGGFTQSLLAIGFIICCKFSELQMNKSIINQAFNFNTEKKSEIRDMQQSCLNQNNMIQSNLINYENGQNKQNNERKEEFLKSDAYQDQLSMSTRNQIFLKDSNNALFSKNPLLRPESAFRQKQQSVDMQKSNMSLKPNEKLSQNIPSNIIHSVKSPENSSCGLKSTKNQDDSQFKKRLDIQAKAKIILSQIIQNKKQDQPTKQDEQQMATQASKMKLSTTQRKNEASEQKSDENINDNRFKKLLSKATNSMQLSILEYVQYFLWPFGEVKKKKQIIDYGMNKLYYHLDVLYVIKKLLEVDKLKRMILDQDQIELFEYLPKPTIHIQDIFSKKGEQQSTNYESEILYQDHRTEKQKAQAAYQAFQNITQRNSRSQLDQKILEHLDPNVLQLFTLNIENGEENQIQPCQEEAQQKNQIEINQNNSINQTNIYSLNLNNDQKMQNLEVLSPIQSNQTSKDKDQVNQDKFEFQEEIQSDVDIGIPQEQTNKNIQDAKSMQFQKLNPPFVG